MMTPRSWIVVALVLVAAVPHSGAAPVEDWTRPVEVTYDLKRCISFRARLSGSFLVVEAQPEPGWHTFALDNRRRAEEKLAGRKALSLDMPTEIRVTGGLQVQGPWHQSPPKDFSRPELRWFSWGFEERALFVAEVRRSGGAPARIAVRGQVCTEAVCKEIDVAIPLPVTTEARPETSDVDLKSLVQVR